MAAIHGKNAILYLQGSGAAAVPLVQAGDWQLNIDFDLPTDTAFGNLYETYLQGLLKGSGSIGGNMDTTQTTLFDAITAGAPVKFYIYPQSSVAANYYYGNMWPKLSTHVVINAVDKFTASFTTDGPVGVH